MFSSSPFVFVWLWFVSVCTPAGGGISSTSNNYCVFSYCFFANERMDFVINYC